MANRRVGLDVDSISNRIDDLALRFFGEAEIGPNPKVDARDSMILRYFPTFVCFCIVLWVITLFFLTNYSLGLLLQQLCLVFCVMFALLGIPCILYMDQGPFPRAFIVLCGLVGAAVIWIFMATTGQTLFDMAVEGVLGFFGIEVSHITTYFLSFVAIFMILTLTTCAVLTVVSAYLRNYAVSVLLSMEHHAMEGVRGKAEKFFMVPDVIDVDSIELEPDMPQGRFDFHCFLSLLVYFLIMGFTISSYVFVNPYFLEAVDWKISLAIMILLSSFIPCLIVPWQFFRSIGAKACSRGNRDYYLWNGAKSRLFSSFLALSSFSMMFLLSLYFGNGIMEILANYAFFLVPLVIISLMYALMFSNNFNRYLVRSVFMRFNEGKEQARKVSQPRLLSSKDKEE